MKNYNRTDHTTRDMIPKLLSSEEISRVSPKKSAAGLAKNDEYVDLDEPSRGVRKSTICVDSPNGRVLPRSAVLESTWRQIVALLATPREPRSLP